MKGSGKPKKLQAPMVIYKGRGFTKGGSNQNFLRVHNANGTIKTYGGNMDGR